MYFIKFVIIEYHKIIFLWFKFEISIIAYMVNFSPFSIFIYLIIVNYIYNKIIILYNNKFDF